jgi:hypothetical protein
LWQGRKLKEFLKVGNTETGPGELRFGFIETVELKNATRVMIPVIVARGEKEGPTLAITAAVHGREISNIEIIRRLIRQEVDPKKLRGTIIAVLMANPLAVEYFSYHTPQDNVNLSRAFPGDSGGSTTERMANAVWQQVLSKANYAIDLHCNPSPCIPFTLLYGEFTDDPEIRKKAEMMAEAFGVTIIDRQLKAGAYLPPEKNRMNVSACCMTNGIPAVTTELIQGSRIVDLSVRVGVRGLLNVIRSIGMMDGKIDEQTEVCVVKGKNRFYGTIKANRSGIVHPQVEPGVELSKGTVVARILDVFGNEVEAVKMPVDGYIWSFPFIENSQAITEGIHLAFVFCRASQ